jgi:hypothetical protein
MKMNKEKLKYEMKRHLSDSTAIMTVANPIYATLETMVVGMTDRVSMQSRVINTGLLYAGMGSLTKLRDFSKKIFKIGKESKEYVKGLHDVLFAATFIVGIKPLVYFASGETDLKKIALATGLGILTGSAVAYPVGYLVDAYRNLTGVEKSGRLPYAVEKQSPKFKKTLATLLTVGSIGATGLVYALNGK